MASITELEHLAGELTKYLPPPSNPKGADRADLCNGRWVVVRAGVGMYAVRAQYTTTQGETVTYRQHDEIIGYPQAIVASLKFAISVAEAGRHYWVKV